jgi:hypothetical protein
VPGSAPPRGTKAGAARFLVMKYEVEILAIAALVAVMVGLGACSSVESDRILASEPRMPAADSPDRSPGLFGQTERRG